MRFKDFFESEEPLNDNDLHLTLKRIPKEHRKLLRGYTYKKQSGGTLKGDEESIGSNDLQHKKIIVAAPWNYGREFALLHEVGHCVWQKYIEPCEVKKNEWNKIVKNTKNKVKQNDEELFCHAYAQYYSKHKTKTYDHPQWAEFIKNVK